MLVCIKEYGIVYALDHRDDVSTPNGRISWKKVEELLKIR